MQYALRPDCGRAAGLKSSSEGQIRHQRQMIRCGERQTVPVKPRIRNLTLMTEYNLLESDNVSVHLVRHR